MPPFLKGPGTELQITLVGGGDGSKSVITLVIDHMV